MQTCRMSSRSGRASERSQSGNRGAVSNQTVPEPLPLAARPYAYAALDAAIGLGLALRCAMTGGGAGAWVIDPRLPELGSRAVLPGSPPSADGAASIYGREYRSWRIEHGVAEGNTEIPAGAYPGACSLTFFQVN